MKKTVLSFTPVSLDKDSRTLKIAASFARKGYRSIVIEHKPSQRNFEDLGIEILSLSTNVNKDLPSSTRQNVLKYYLIKFLKFIWHGMRFIGLGSINDRLSFKEYKIVFEEKYSLNNNLISQADIYYFHSFEYTHFALSLPKDDFIVYDAHDFYTDMQPSSQYSSLVRNWLLPYQKCLEKKLIERANIFVTVSRGIAQKYEEAYEKKPYIVCNAHDSRIDLAINKDIRAELYLDKSAFIVCVMGNFKLGMAYEESVEAFTKLADDTHLVFIGAGYENKLKSNSNIHFIDSLNPREIVPFIGTADCGLINYFDFTEDYKYALPNRFFQMVAAGLPLLYPAQLVEIDKINKIYEFGIPVDVKCVHDIVKNVKRMRTKKTVENFKKNIKKAQEEIGWEKEEQKLIKLLLKN
jgi:hypothetical protein